MLIFNYKQTNYVETFPFARCRHDGGCGHVRTDGIGGNVEPVTVEPIEGGYANLFLTEGTGGYGFYPATAPFALEARSAHLRLPANLVDGGSCVKIAYEEDADGIKEFENMKWEMDNDAIYNLSGRKYDKKPTTPGLYIMNGKKVVIR